MGRSTVNSRNNAKPERVDVKFYVAGSDLSTGFVAITEDD